MFQICKKNIALRKVKKDYKILQLFGQRECTKNSRNSKAVHIDRTMYSKFNFVQNGNAFNREVGFWELTELECRLTITRNGEKK